MAAIQITFAIDNAAFVGDNFEAEIQYILKQAEEIITGKSPYITQGFLKDSNGNTIGRIGKIGAIPPSLIKE